MGNREFKPKEVDGKTLDQMPSIFVAIPNMGNIRTDLMLRVISWSRGMKMILFPPQNYSPVSVARNLCVSAFLNGGYDYLFFVDADTVPPPDAIEKLLATGKDIITGVTCNFKLCEDGLLRPAPMVFRFANGKDKEDGLEYVLKPEGIEKVDAFGMSCCLIHKSVFDNLEEPWFKEEFVPDKGKKPIGEDIKFCYELRDKGQDLWCDFSVHCDHWKMTKVTYPNQTEVARHDVMGGIVKDTNAK
jgi:hypothetical protein